MTTRTGTPTFRGASLKTEPGTAPDVDPDLTAKANEPTDTKEGPCGCSECRRETVTRDFVTLLCLSSGVFELFEELAGDVAHAHVKLPRVAH